MFAILPLSSGLSARGDLEVLLSPKAGDCEIGGIYRALTVNIVDWRHNTSPLILDLAFSLVK
jgi:hypothetical protein